MKINNPKSVVSINNLNNDQIEFASKSYVSNKITQEGASILGTIKDGFEIGSGIIFKSTNDQDHPYNISIQLDKNDSQTQKYLKFNGEDIPASLQVQGIDEAISKSKNEILTGRIKPIEDKFIGIGDNVITGYVNDQIRYFTDRAYGITIKYESESIPKLQIVLNENNETQKYLSLNYWNGDGKALTLSGIDKAINDAVSGKADKSELSEFVTATDIETAVSGKADKSEIANFITATDIETAVSGKADKDELTDFVTAENVTEAIAGKADTEELISQNEYLEKKLKIFEEMLFNVKSKVGTKISSIENISGDINEDIVIELDTPINDVKSVSGLTITVTELNVESGRVVFTTPGDTIIQNLSTSGNLPQGVSNAQFSINTQGNVNISNCDDLNQTSYNCFEIGLSNEPPKSVTIENVHIKGTLRNNAISIFGTVDDAVINISNVIIDNCSNPIRISNKTNASGVVLNLINCEFTQWEAGQYAGAIICQDYTSTTAALAQENNLFAPNKITINFINCTHNGEKIMFNNPAEICTTGDENQVVYVYTDREGIIPYNTDRYPTITCK